MNIQEITVYNTVDSAGFYGCCSLSVQTESFQLYDTHCTDGKWSDIIVSICLVPMYTNHTSCNMHSVTS